VGFLIDTDIWVAVERGTLDPADIHAVTGTEPVFLSPVNVAELQTGIELVEDEATRRKALAAMRRLHRKPLLRMDHDTGVVFGQLAAQLRKQGRGEEFRVMDLWLAAQAVQRRFKLLTLNEKHFKDIPGLSLVVLPEK
jgi:predicted nucleic acid-binding protein